MGDRGRAILKSTTGDAEPVLPAPHGGDLDLQIIDATRRLIARWGIAKTTVADIAQEAGCSRATIYRAFAGGRQELLGAVGRADLDVFFEDLAQLVDQSPDLESAIEAVIVYSTVTLGAHEGFQFMLVHEPGMVLPFLGFHRIDRLYRTIRDQLGPHLERFAGDGAGWAVEWAARITLSFIFQPSSAVDLTDPDTVHRLVQTRLLPGLVGTRDESSTLFHAIPA